MKGFASLPNGGLIYLLFLLSPVKVILIHLSFKYKNSNWQHCDFASKWSFQLVSNRRNRPYGWPRKWLQSGRNGFVRSQHENGEVWHVLQGEWRSHWAAALDSRCCVHPTHAWDTSWPVCSTHWSHHSVGLQEITQLRKCQGILISLLVLLHLAGVETGKFHLQFHSPLHRILCMCGQENKAQQISAPQQWGNFLANLCSSSGSLLSSLLLFVPHSCCGPVTLY